MNRISKDRLIAFTRSSGIASEEPQASSAGLKIFMKDGNAADVAVATSLALAVTIPHLGGIGGDFYAMVMDPNGRVYVINGSGYAPSGLTRDFLISRGYDKVPSTGPLSPVVPGMIEGLRILHERFGSLEWKELVEPAKEIARKGFSAPPSLVKALKENRRLLEEDEGSKATYLSRKIEREGDLVRFLGLARLLDEISEDPRNFYEDEVAERIVEYVNDKGGVMNFNDFKNFRGHITDPIKMRYRSWTIWEMPPNTQGLTTFILLKLLEDREISDEVSRARMLFEASRTAYLVRDRYLGDPRYMKYSPEDLLREEFLASLRTEERGRSNAEGDTTFFVVVDSEEMVVAGIQSLFYAFGSGVTEPLYQVTLNSRAQAFTLEKGLPNTLEPLKRPLHTLSAVFMKNDDQFIALGLSGGNLRPQFHYLLITNIVDLGMDVAEAISHVRYGLVPGTNEVVADRQVIDALKAIEGIRVKTGRTGVASALEVNERIRILATDPRGDGYPYVLP